MKVFKFGGASVKDALGVKNILQVIKIHPEPLLIVVSAMGKTTNALERLLDTFYNNSDVRYDVLSEIKAYHNQMLIELFPQEHSVFEAIDSWFRKLEIKISETPSQNYNYEYDQIVFFGEMISTQIISAYLNAEGVNTQWTDIRKLLKTNNQYRAAKVDFIESKNRTIEYINNELEADIMITQGFVGSTDENLTTTLGREGSDYTAALLASFVNAESLTVWKDVPGVLNADPKWFDDTIKINELSYTDAIELAFYGASVLHPKTIQPIKKSGIPLYVKSFMNPEASGTLINNDVVKDVIPCFIFKINQVLLNFASKDLSFIAEENLEKIFGVFAKYSFRINLMQNTAVSFKSCVDDDELRISKILNDLELDFNISLERNLELITIRYYNQETIDRVIIGKEVLLEQHGKNTVQMVVRKQEE